MGAKRSQEMKNAVQMVISGKTVSEAAEECDLCKESIYRVLKKIRLRLEKDVDEKKLEILLKVSSGPKKIQYLIKS